MPAELSIGKSICVLATVILCFAVLWPGIFYPMFSGSVFGTNEELGCCDILLDKDVNAVKLVDELCGNVLKWSALDALYSKNGLLNKDGVAKCRTAVLDTCSIDINVLLKDKVQLGPNYKNFLEDVRTVNKSLCLKYNFGVTLEIIGVPHRTKDLVSVLPKHIKQERERAMYSSPASVHPALREKGRAIPEAHVVPKVPREVPAPVPQSPQQAMSALRKPPIPGVRPPVGSAAGQVPQQKSSGVLGILMPMYTIGIVIFFSYTVIKLLNRKRDDNNDDANRIEHRRNLLNSLNHYYKQIECTSVSCPASNGDATTPSKTVVSALAGLLQDVNHDISEKGTIHCKGCVAKDTEKDKIKDDTQKELETVKNGSVKVVGMETTASCENGKQWLKSNTPPPKKNDEIPHGDLNEIIIPAKIPSNCQVLVSDAHTDSIPDDNGNDTVVLESKVTLSVISPEQVQENVVKKDGSLSVSSDLVINDDADAENSDMKAKYTSDETDDIEKVIENGTTDNEEKEASQEELIVENAEEELVSNEICDKEGEAVSNDAGTLHFGTEKTE